MKKLFMASVGDGLCFGKEIEPDYFSGNYIQFDWGGESVEAAVYGNVRLARTLGNSYKYDRSRHIGPDTFFLTHYHYDHYCGLVAAAKNRKHDMVMWAPNQVYAPGMPKFTGDKEFYGALYCINAYMLGSDRTSMEFDLLSAISNLGGGNNPRGIYNFKFKRLYKGDIVKVGAETFEVIWPPKELNETKYTKQMQRAVEAYEKAKEEDEQFREFANHIEETTNENNMIWEDGEFRYNEVKRYYKNNEDDNCKPVKSTVVKDANKQLRNAANSLSLVVFQPKNFLMMGDASKETYRSIIKYLVDRKSIDFETIITPHHGTYWGNELFSLRGENVLISNGRKLISKYQHEWGMVSDRVWSTFLNNDIYL